MNAPAAVGGYRLQWPDLPVPLRERIEAELGAAVVAAQSQPGGFSPGLASRLRLADGRRVFAKAASAQRSEFTVDAHRREAEVLAALPRHLPVGRLAPRLLWFDEYEDWTALLIEDVDGHSPAQPWQPAEFDLARAALAELSQRLTPSPLAAPSMVAELADNFSGWRTLAASGTARPGQFAWAWDNLARLAELEATWPQAAAGDSLLHGDARADNMLVTAGGIVLVDWPSVVTGPAWGDLLLMMPSAIMQGITDPERVWREFAPATDADPDAVNAVLAALAGFFVSRSLQPAPPHLDNLRPFQAAQGAAALSWLRLRTGNSAN
jgi:aminoglycoside phosphotransferase (APT) family kinase protein